MQSTMMRSVSTRPTASRNSVRASAYSDFGNVNGIDMAAAARALQRMLLNAQQSQPRSSDRFAPGSRDPWGLYGNPGACSSPKRPSPSPPSSSGGYPSTWTAGPSTPWTPPPGQAAPASNDTPYSSGPTSSPRSAPPPTSQVPVQGPGSTTASAPASVPSPTSAAASSDGTWRPSPSTFTATPSTPSIEALIAELDPEEQRTVRLFQDNARSVVNVSTTASYGPLFSPFFAQQQVPRGVGSGFIWDTAGHVVTNAHVIAGSKEVTVTLSDGTVAKAQVVGGDREKDIAVLKLQDLSQEQMSSLRPVQLGSSSNLLVGQRVFAVGNPFGLDLALSQGIVSGLGREISTGGMWGGLGAASITNGIQTDTAMNPGNSGGPLLDSAGRVVGIATAIVDPTGRGISSGVGFAIPIDAVRGMVDQILRVGRVVRPALGISIAPVPQAMQGRAAPSWSSQAERPAKAEGVLVVTVQPGGPADVAGVQPTRRELTGRLLLGDIITGINGRAVRMQKDLFAALDQCQVGDVVELVLMSAAGTSRTVNITLADRERMAGSE
ncbi:hypothetical protein QJQ45_018471 [Haematococcus lacustris]|nr:hypothetical protein QJQ45_018471 [Haematococcus lacustris]